MHSQLIPRSSVATSIFSYRRNVNYRLPRYNFVICVRVIEVLRTQNIQLFYFFFREKLRRNKYRRHNLTQNACETRSRQENGSDIDYNKGKRKKKVKDNILVTLEQEYSKSLGLFSIRKVP